MTRGNVSKYFAESRKLFEDAILNGRRSPAGAFDYGDEATVLLHLKRVGSCISELKEDNYGVYLGKHNDGYVVGIKSLFGDGLTGCEVFETEDEMKVSWQLD